MDELQGLRIGFVTASEGVEQVELVQPWELVEKAGDERVPIAPKRARRR